MTTEIGTTAICASLVVADHSHAWGTDKAKHDIISYIGNMAPSERLIIYFKSSKKWSSSSHLVSRNGSNSSIVCLMTLGRRRLNR